MNIRRPARPDQDGRLAWRRQERTRLPLACLARNKCIVSGLFAGPPSDYHEARSCMRGRPDGLADLLPKDAVVAPQPSIREPPA